MNHTKHYITIAFCSFTFTINLTQFKLICKINKSGIYKTAVHHNKHVFFTNKFHFISS